MFQFINQFFVYCFPNKNKLFFYRFFFGYMFFVDSLVYWFGWQGNARPPGHSGTLGDTFNILGSTIFLITSFMYLYESHVSVLVLVMMMEAVANVIFFVSAMGYMYAWVRVDKQRGCILSNSEMWANCMNVLGACIYIFSSLGVLWLSRWRLASTTGPAGRSSSAVTAQRLPILRCSW